MGYFAVKWFLFIFTDRVFKEWNLFDLKAFNYDWELFLRAADFADMHAAGWGSILWPSLDLIAKQLEMHRWCASKIALLRKTFSAQWFLKFSDFEKSNVRTLDVRLKYSR